jgi:hypothetical protein
MKHNVLISTLLLFATAGCRPAERDLEWIRAFGYQADEVISVEIGEFGYPYVAVNIAGSPLMLAFDTGNMVGVSIASGLFDQLGLSSDGSWTLLDSSGEIVRSYRVAEAVEVATLGRYLGATPVYELDHPTISGLVGPTVLGGGRFTLDYRSGRMAMSMSSPPDTVTGYHQIPLVRSNRHPTLILIHGTIEGRTILLQLDTGKSRTVINPVLASDLELEQDSRGVSIQNLRIGDLLFRVRSAKKVDQTGIDPGLPDQILVGIGSDILSRFVWTVDYDAGVLWIPASL